MVPITDPELHRFVTYLSVSTDGQGRFDLEAQHVAAAAQAASRGRIVAFVWKLMKSSVEFVATDLPAATPFRMKFL